MREQSALQVQPHSSADTEEISLSAYWNILLKNRRIIIAISLLVSGLGAYFALSATTLYTATAMISIEPQNPRVTGVGELQPLDLRDRNSSEYDYHQTQFALLKSRPLAARIITELGLEANETFLEAKVVKPDPVQRLKLWLAWTASYISPLFKSAPPATDESDPIQYKAESSKRAPELTVTPGLLDRYLGFVAVDPIPETRLVRVHFTTPSPALSQVLANAHVDGFMRMSLETRFTLTEEAREFLNQKKSELLQKLEKAEAALNRFRRANGVFSIEKGENIVVDRLVDLNRQLTVARGQRLEAESLNRTVENRSYQNLAEIMRQPLVQQLNSNVATLEAEKARLATIFQPAHPRIQELNQQIATAKEALKSEIANVVRGIRSNYAAAVAKERALQAEAEAQQRDALKLKELGVQYTVLQEEVNANRSLYEGLSKRLNETNVSNDIAVSNMQVVERAAKPLLASAPNVPLYLFASVVSGLFLGVGAAFLREFFDSTVASPGDVWRSVGLATLGVVPRLQSLVPPTYRQRLIGAKRTRLLPPVKELITEHAPLSIINEAYRTIRTSLLLSQADKPPQVILVTSPSSGDGKTVTSLNLAIALARDAHNVLLVDADMRLGCCHNRLGLTNNRGLSNILTGQLSLDEGIQETSVNGLSLLSRGVPPPNPSELLGSRKMKDVLQNLRQRFDFILIDSTPLLGISDAAILSVISDGVLLVLDAQNTSTAVAQKAVESLDLIRARPLGVVLNAVDLDNPDYAYYRNYSRYYNFSPDDHRNPQPQSVGSCDEPSTFESALDYENGLQSKNENSHDRHATENMAIIPEFDHSGSVDSGTRHDGATLKRTTGIKTTVTDNRRLRRTDPDGDVSDECLGRLIKIFTEAVGPMGVVIIREHIAILGESRKSFPKSRIDELIQSIEQEIMRPEIRSQFRKQIVEQIQSAGIQ